MFVGDGIGESAASDELVDEGSAPRLVEGVEVEVLVTTIVEPTGGTVSSIVVSAPFVAIELGDVAGGVAGVVAGGVAGSVAGGIVGGAVGGSVGGSRDKVGAMVVRKVSNGGSSRKLKGSQHTCRIIS